MQREKLKIEYSHNGKPYEVVLTAIRAGFFQDAAKQEGLRSLDGEELVKAMLEYADGAILRVERFKNGRRNDGPNGEYAVAEYGKHGELTDASHYKNDKRENGPHGEPAFQKFNAEGRRTYIVYYNNGMRNDGPNGEPAEQICDNDGNLVFVARFQHDNRIHSFTVDEMRELEQKAKASVSRKQKPQQPKL